MAVKIATVRSSRDLTDFVELPYGLNKNHPLWIPPLKSQEKAILSPGKHPFWETASRELFVAYKDGKPAGRIAAIVDTKYNEYAHASCGSFGFFECINDQDVANHLLAKASDWLSEQGMTFMRGPLNPSANYTCGMLVDGFEHAPALMMPWNPGWYPTLLENWRMHKEQDLFAYVINRQNLELPDWLKAEVSKLKEEGRFTCRPASKATLAQDIRAMLNIYQEAWANNWGFSPLSDREAENHVKELKGILDPDFFALFFDGQKPVAGMVALPDMNPLLKRLNGKISFLAPWHFWNSRKEISRGLRIMLFGILPEYRLHGLPALLLDYMLEKARNKPNLEWVEGSWILEDNPAMNDLMEDFSGQLSKRYRIYRREIGQC